MSIRLIALDLDGTTLNSRNELTRETEETLRRAILAGVTVSIASGRTFSALPKEVLEIPGIRYAISSNGAAVTDLTLGKRIRTDYIPASAVRRAIEISKEEGLPIEAFTGGRAYIARNLYEEIVVHGSLHRNRDYVMNTRTPLEDIYAFMEEHVEQIENINFFFENDRDLAAYSQLIHGIQNANITSSVPNNLEVGGIHSTKAEAVRFLMELLSVEREEVMCFGDARNDIPMLQLAGIGVAMGNAWDEVKAEADYITDTNDRDGVAKAIRRFVFGE